MAAPLLAFHKEILEEIHDPSTSDLLILARGLGLRRIICTLMKIYDSPQNLVLLVNAAPEEEVAIGEELGIMGCRKPGLRIVGYEMGKRDRQDLYKKGGLISVTSRILVVDMLQADMPTELITGIIVLHAERVTALALEAFIVRLYREKNTTGFLKAFSEQPEFITSGMSPLKNIMKELQLRSVHIYPRFHQSIKNTLESRKADVVELYQHLTENMSAIHHAIVQCMTITLSELKRSNTSVESLVTSCSDNADPVLQLELDDLTVENAYFKSFDAVVRRQLDPVWHKVGPRTKQLVSDLATLRRLLTFLLSYDAFGFNAYLETLAASNTTTAAGTARQNQSPWMLTDAANIIFQTAKRRCYTLSRTNADRTAAVIDLVDDEDAWDALDDMEGHGVRPPAKPTKPWIPDGMDPVLEELPKWDLLADVLHEIEEEVMRQESLSSYSRGSNIVLVMTSSPQSSALVSEFLSKMDVDAPKGQRGRKMMEPKLRRYLYWKGRLASQKDGKGGTPMQTEKTAPQVSGSTGSAGVSEALQKKDRERAGRGVNRRRVRGGAPSSTAPSKPKEGSKPDEVIVLDDGEEIATFFASQSMSTNDLTVPEGDMELLEGMLASQFDADFDMHYGILPPQQTVIVRSYSDDTDDQVLAEIQPKFVVMFEPSLEFVRRIEVYRNSSPGLGVRVYFMVYQLSCEEHKYLAGLRREKESFERLIKERGVRLFIYVQTVSPLTLPMQSMLLPIYEDKRLGSKTGEQIIKSISSRLAGGRKELSTQASQVIVDMREFRSTLPSLLHASGLLVIPATLTVGDYVLTPDICVERKSIPDLISSFNSGRLYTQCELMSVHYKQPVLLIEFEENKAFSLEVRPFHPSLPARANYHLQTVSLAKPCVKQSAKYPPKKGGTSTESERALPSIQSKIVLLTLHFPRVRIIWSSSPYATTDIFSDLKAHNPEPDPSRAIAIGAEEDPNVGAGVNAAAEELLGCIPGVTAKNVKYVMSKVRSVRELCALGREEVQGILGVEPGKVCWEFMHRGERKRQAGSLGSPHHPPPSGTSSKLIDDPEIFRAVADKDASPPPIVASVASMCAWTGSVQVSDYVARELVHDIRPLHTNNNLIPPAKYELMLCGATVRAHFTYIHIFIKKSKKHVYLPVVHKLTIFRLALTNIFVSALHPLKEKDVLEVFAHIYNMYNFSFPMLDFILCNLYDFHLDRYSSL
ncbi:hypothetical protein JVT61DRAFT_6861 [Boletus reticuloceps]|uniref:ERCC4 domain-containing protein n=1 Tax=Boletus reticuloceps TaxID=495285 RepID=A0A8I3A898_9AGAM|nr:hypothetical protein JVT61DRAFT_6861 [Boletus reticuloceps]